MKKYPMKEWYVLKEEDPDKRIVEINEKLEGHYRRCMLWFKIGIVVWSIVIIASILVI